MEAVTEKEERGAESVQRWTAKRRSALVLSILRGETRSNSTGAQAYMASLLGKLMRDCSPNSPARAGYTSHFVLQSKVHPFLLPLCRGPTTPISLLSVVLRQAADFSAKCVA